MKKVVLLEKSKYELLDAYVKLNFEIKIKKENLSNLFLIELGSSLSQGDFNFSPKENEEFIFIEINGPSISGNFVNSVEKYKRFLTQRINNLCLKYNYNIDTEFIYNYEMKDVFEERKKVSLAGMEKENYFISENPENYLEKNNSMDSLRIKIGRLYYHSEMFNTGVLAKKIIEFAKLNNIKTSSDKVYYSVSKEILEELIDYLEERNKESLL